MVRGCGQMMVCHEAQAKQQVILLVPKDIAPNVYSNLNEIVERRLFEENVSQPPLIESPLRSMRSKFLQKLVEKIVS